MDAAAAAVAVNAIFLTDQIDFSKVTPQMDEAFRLAYPSVDLLLLSERSPAEIQGFLAGWKGKYFEVLVRDQLNSGDSVGDIQLHYGQVAELAVSPTQPGWDLQILNPDGSLAHELQLKASTSLGYVKEAIERYPDIQIVSTTEVIESAGEVPSLFSSGVSNSSLESTVRAPMEALLDSPLEELVETVLPGLPFVLILASEGRHVLMGRKAFEMAAREALYRAAKTGAAIGVGALVIFLDGGVLSIPATFLTRFGFDRYLVMERSVALLDKRIEKLVELRQPLLLGKP